jgi:beta-glucosidase
VTVSGGGLDVGFRVRNVGNYAGSDVAQVYLGPSADLPPAVAQAVRKLAQFQRIMLAPGRAQDVRLHVTAQALSSWSTAAQHWVLGTGHRTVYVGSSSRDLPLRATVEVRG